MNRVHLGLCAFFSVPFAQLLIGCTVQPYLANGEITTKNNAEYVIENKDQRFILKPGRAKLEVSKNPTLLGTFELYNWGGSLKATTHRDDYDESGLSINSRESGFPYDIRINWQQYGTEAHSALTNINCVTNGVCTGKETVLDCGGKIYVEGTEDYNKNLKNKSCISNTITAKKYRNNCPGRQRAERGFLNSTTRIQVHFTNPRNRNDIVADFDGFTDSSSKSSWTKRVGECFLIDK